MATDPTWYRPICDQVLAKVAYWLAMYDRGKESADRKWMSPSGILVDRVTKRSQTLRFTTLQIDHLIRLLEALAEHQELTADFRTIRDRVLPRGRLFPGGEREVELSFFKADVEEILSVLTRAKSGKLKTTADIVEEQREAGKGAFEL